jgi:hypothetical protein
MLEKLKGFHGKRLRVGPSKMSSIVLTANLHQIAYGKHVIQHGAPGPASITIRSLPPWTVKMLRDEANIIHIITMKGDAVKRDNVIGKL